MGNKLCLFIILSVFVFGSLAIAQDKVPDPGIPDTVAVQSLSIDEGYTESFPIEITLYNDEDLGGFGLPITWDSPDLICDSINFDGSRVDYVGTKPTQIDNDNHKLQVGMVIIMESYLESGSGNIFTAYFHVAPGAPAQVVTFDSTSFSEASPFVLTLSVGQNIVPQFVQGTLTIGNPVANPTIALSTDHLDFTGTEGAANPASQTFSVSNSGDGTLEWTASASDSWITVSPASGTDAGDVTVGVDVTGMTAGDYSGTVTISDPNATNNPQTVAINLHLDPTPPCLSLSTHELNFSGIEGESKSMALTISDCGGQTLNWTLSGIDESWLSVDMTSGSTTGDQIINFTVDFTGLAPGDYQDVVTIAGEAGTTNSPQDVTINVHVIDTTPEADTVWVSHPSVTAGNQVVVDVNYQNFITIGSIADLPLTYSGDNLVCDSVSFVGSRVEYMQPQLYGVVDNTAKTIVITAIPVESAYLQPGNGLLAKLYFSVAPEAATQTTVIDTTAVDVHTYTFVDTNGSVRPTEFYSGGIDITGLPCFDFPVDSVTFTGELGTAIASQSFSATNSCYGTLEVTGVTDDADWLTVTSADPFVFSVNTAGMTEGDYTATVTFESNAINSPVEIPVKLTLYAVPELAVSPTSFDFGTVCKGTTLHGQFDIANTGTGTLNWTADALEAVALSAYSGTAPTTVTFDVATDNLDFGPQTLTVTVAADGVAGSPVTISLAMNIANCDECTFDIAEVEGMQGFPVAVPIYAYQVSNVAALEFHMEFDGNVLQIDSVTSDYLSGPTIGLLDPPINQIHYVWDNIGQPVTIPDGDPIMTLWFTAIGSIGDEGAISWLDGNEVVDPFGGVIQGIGYCGGTVTVIEPTFDLFGKVTYYDMAGRAVEGVNIDIAGPDNNMTVTDANGEYSFPGLHLGSYTITPSRDTDDPGVSVADIIAIRRHLAYVERFASPYQMIAADVNLTNTVSVADVVMLRRYLADLEALPSGNWTFVAGDYGITMENWPTAPRSINVDVINQDIYAQDFYAIRLGDVNNTWSPMTAAKLPYASNDVIDVSFGESQMENGLITVPIQVSDVNDLVGLELHLACDNENLRYVGINSDILSNVTYNGNDNAIHIIWEELNAPLNISGSQTIAEVIFKAENSSESSGEISISRAELVNSEGLPFRLDTSDKGVINGHSAIPNAYSLSQNVPNPFNPTTTIMATMSEPGEYLLTIYNISGQEIKTFSGYNEAGTVEFTWDGTNDFGVPVSSGIYLYTFRAGSFTDTKKMVLLK